MDILMQIGLGLANHDDLNKTKEKEIYHDIINSTNTLVKAKCSYLRFVEISSGKTQKEVFLSDGNCNLVKNVDLLEIQENIHVKKKDNFLIISSQKTLNNVKSFLIIEGYGEVEGESPNNQEMLKFLASQALFLYAYSARRK
jgi:hypothetical protein